MKSGLNIIKYCKYCGKQLKRKRYNGRLEDPTIFKKRIYCNRECMKKDKTNIGKNNSNWSNSHTTARNINKLIMKKDKCEICGKTGKLDIHHKDGDYNNNNIDNLMCICRSCHTKIHRPKSKCIICGKPMKAKGYCDKHYQRYKKYGDPLITKYN